MGNKMCDKNIVLVFIFLIFVGIINCQSQGVPIGELCNINEDCDGFPESTECDLLIGFCYCNKDHVISPGDEDHSISCQPIRLEIGETCKVSAQCTHGIPGPLSDCVPDCIDPTEYICDCTIEAVHEPGEHVCYLKRNFIGDSCEVDAQCKANMGDLSFCMSQMCTCKEEAVVNRNGTSCLPIVNVIGEQCEESHQCTVGRPGMYSDCVESLDNPNIKVCDCIGGAKPEPGQHECLKSNGYIGETCKLDGDCVGNPGISSACSSSGTCLCLGGYLSSSQMDDCIAIRNGLGESCMESSQCQKGIPGMLSACILGSCRCTSFGINEPGEDFCHRKATLVGDPCQIHEQCWANLSEKSYCVGGKCECMKNDQPSIDLSTCV